jgi:SAM-dependent methyltransferase
MAAGTDIAEHLGGFVIGGDPATQFPDLWDWLVRTLGIRSVLDVGCGDGQAVAHFQKLGCDVLGIDGVPQDAPEIMQWDYTGGAPVLERSFDLCWSCEFVEHVEERFVPNILDSFQHCTLVVMTHAEPGQGGHHHVNCQPKPYWCGALAAVGYFLDEKLTEQSRRLAAINTDPYNHFLRSGLAFRRVK